MSRRWSRGTRDAMMGADFSYTRTTLKTPASTTNMAMHHHTIKNTKTTKVKCASQ
jgi:hypothetical protein